MQRRTRIKICGITRVNDALAAAEAGADAIGLVFYPHSKRHVSLDQAREIRRALPAFVTCVGLFVNAEPDRVTQAIKQVALDVLQFHGEETVAECERYEHPYIKAVRVRGREDIENAQQQFVSAQALLLDSFHQQQQGGTGTAFDWSIVPGQRQASLILAGGLTPENVREAIQTVRPYAVDVSSGVELEPGIKSAKLINQFVTEVSNDN
jgi:phosphoribosylanthranilate isomerase